ncbi:hypothetical protein GGTG_02234 [Gaeumannomyces tritici R3-111a-1]|uniref:Uncharacterized protein n=1 Tax=Gaeumannomyces tritici (strain R3-111a-1) TaxID=644352 RepID=J3NLT4_GAET3|nr:hypothetical protein GGTG_02234 [Gaeumannomyces tritici R3-111a-1]EJT82260.1 hypothetical protein GGTG_02234 [Gaeumannomyces tritici R3-111a-1]
MQQMMGCASAMSNSPKDLHQLVLVETFRGLSDVLAITTRPWNTSKKTERQSRKCLNSIADAMAAIRRKDLDSRRSSATSTVLSIAESISPRTVPAIALPFPGYHYSTFDTDSLTASRQALWLDTSVAISEGDGRDSAPGRLMSRQRGTTMTRRKRTSPPPPSERKVGLDPI